MKPLLLGVLLWPSLALAQNAAITFTFDNPALQPAHYVMTIPEKGAGHFTSEPGSAPVQGGAQPEPQDREITFPEEQRVKLFTLARKNKLFAVECGNQHGNLAFTGNKTLAYKGPEGTGACTFNYARDQKIGQAADALIAVASTLEEGRKLEVLLAHDKLGLNDEVDILAGEQASGRALALGNIAPVLRAIVADPDVLNHTRTRVEALLKP